MMIDTDTYKPSHRWKIGNYYAALSLELAYKGEYRKAYYLADEARRQRERAEMEDEIRGANHHNPRVETADGSWQRKRDRA